MSSILMRTKLIGVDDTNRYMYNISPEIGVHKRGIEPKYDLIP